MSDGTREVPEDDLNAMINQVLDMAVKRQHRAALVGFGMGIAWASRQDILPVDRERLIRVAGRFADRFMDHQALEMELEIPIGHGLLDGLEDEET